MPKTRDTGTASAHTTGQSLPLLSGHLFRVHPAHAVGALSWRGAIRGMPGTALSAQQTLRAAWPACPARGLLLDSTRVDLRQHDFAPHSPFGNVWSLWFSQLEVGVHASGIRRVGARDAAEGPARHRSPPVRSSPALAFTAVRRSRELTLLVLRACPPGPPAAKPCRATCGAHGFGVGVRGARSRAGGGVDGAGDLQPARCWELESRSRLCRPMQVCARLPVCFLVPETWCPPHRTGTHQDTSGGRGEQRRQRSAVIPSSVSVRAGFWPRATNPVQHELWGAVGPGTVTECSAGVTKLPRRCPC